VKLSEFKSLIREEVKKILTEAKALELGASLPGQKKT
jgi:hypothetical protein